MRVHLCWRKCYQPPDKMKALVTGCAGFIGSHLVDKLLEMGYEAVGIDSFTDYYPIEIKEANLSNVLKSKNFKLIGEDILEMNEYPEVDYVFHEAAQAGVRASWGNSFEIYTRNNIETTQKLLEFYKDRKIKKFVYASSSSVYGNAELPMREDSLPSIVASIYPADKKDFRLNPYRVFGVNGAEPRY